MLVTYPDIYAAQRHHVQAVEPPSRYIIAPPFTPLLRNSSKRSMLSLTIVVLLTSELSLIDDKDDAMVCLCAVLSYTTIRDTTEQLAINMDLQDSKVD